MFSMVNPEVRPGGKGKDSKDPNTVRKPLDWRLNLKKDEKKHGDWIGGHGREYGRDYMRS
jgi:hypothetical protein